MSGIRTYDPQKKALLKRRPPSYLFQVGVLVDSAACSASERCVKGFAPWPTAHDYLANVIWLNS